MFEYAEGELIGIAIWDRAESEEQREQNRQYFLTLVKDRPLPSTGHTRNLTKEGRTSDLQVDWNYKQDEQGRLKGGRNQVVIAPS